MARKTLKEILALPDNKQKEYAVCNFILRSMPGSEDWKKAKTEWERLKEDQA